LDSSVIVTHDAARRRWNAFAVVALVWMIGFFASRVAFSQDEDQELATTQIPSGPYRIAGMVVNGKAGGPLSRVRVTIADTKNRQSVQSMITGDDGHFQFRVPAGKYSLEGARRGFITSFYEQHEQFWTAIVTGVDVDAESLILRLKPNAILSGAVFDEFQEPVRNGQITLYKETHNQGVSRIVRLRTTITDDQGHYEFARLDEGAYFVSAQASPWYAIHPSASLDEDGGSPVQVDSSLDVVYPITYYGDTTETDGALPIPLRSGDRLEADIHLNPAPALRFLVHIPEGGHGAGFVLQKATLDGSEQVESSGYEIVNPGLLEVSGVAAGRYTVKMFDPKGAGRESSEVDVNGSGELDLSSGSLLSTVKVAAQLAGSGGLPARLMIGLRNSKGRTQFSEVNDKGETAFTDVLPGKYYLVTAAPTGGYSVVQVASAAGVASGHLLNVPPGTTLNAAVAVVRGSASFAGFAKQDGKAVGGAMIVLVPKDPVADHDRFRRDQSDLDGSFTLREVIPGEYTVVAIQDGWDLDWSEPTLLGRYLARGERVDATAGTVSLGVVAVQAK
jgi:hypothetical protein